MTEILERLCLFKYITVVTLEEDVILNEPVNDWPHCDCLISFHSKGTALLVCPTSCFKWIKLLVNTQGQHKLNMQYIISKHT